MPLAYFAILGALAIYMMGRLGTNINKQALRPLKEPHDADGTGDGGGGIELAEADRWTHLADHLDTIELYVPPLTATLLSSVYESKLTEFGIPVEELGFRPLVTSTGTGPSGLVVS